MAGEVMCLVESALDTSPGMQRHRRYHIRAGQDLRPSDPQHLRERTRQAPTAFVLECMNDPAERPLIEASGARRVDCTRKPATSRAAFERSANHTPGG